MLKVAAMLLACAEGTSLNAEAEMHHRAHHRAHAHHHAQHHAQHRQHKFSELDEKENKLSQSFATAFQMAPPKLMTTKPLPGAGKGGCPTGAKSLTYKASGGAFIDGCYMNTTRKQERDEATGEEAQHYLYMWKHACAYTKWVPSNQFMYSNLDYDATTMTLERFGFIGMDKRCFWGAIGVLWKRPLPVHQIMPNTTDQVVVPVGPPKPKPAEIPDKPVVVQKVKGVYEICSELKEGRCIQFMENQKYLMQTRVDDLYAQHWWISGITSEIYLIQSEQNTYNFFQAAEDGEGKYMKLVAQATNQAKDYGSPSQKNLWWRKVEVEKDHVYALESMEFPGWYLEDPGTNTDGKFNLKQASNILEAKNVWGHFHINHEHDHPV